MTEACKYVSLKLAEVESKAKFRKEIQGFHHLELTHHTRARFEDTFTAMEQKEDD